MSDTLRDRVTRLGVRATAVFALSASLLCPARVRAAGTWYVDGSNPMCRDTASGTFADPYCSITAALAAHHAPGTTILVLPGIYRERVSVPASGLPGAPLELRGTPGAVVEGADDFSDPDLWQRHAGDVWLAASVTWSPNQVFVDSVRLVRWKGLPEDVPPGGFTYAAGTGLFVNVGGENPGMHEVLVGHRSYGFQMSRRSWVSIREFRIEHADLKGVYLTLGSHDVEIVANSIGQPYRYGIQADTCSDVRIADNVLTHGGDHGIVFTRGTTRSRIERNESAYHASPLARQANGVYLFRSPGNEIRDNRLHDNQDSGVQIQSGSNGVLCVQNRSWHNGDHGFDTLMARDNVFVGNVSHGNFRDGFSFEGNSTGNSLHDCIATDNGLSTNEPDLWVDDASLVGFTSDANVFWNSTTQPPVKVGARWFASVADYGARHGLDARTLQADPRFVAPGAGDFRLASGSPAIDAADSGVPGWPALDAEGRARRDEPATRDTGTGPVTYADRGALEHDPGALAAGGTISSDPRLEESSALASAEPTEPGSAPELRPNPARLQASLRFRLARPGPVRLSICDAGGRLVRGLLDERDAPAGLREVTWDLTDRTGARLRAGMYFWRLRSPAGEQSGCFALVR